MSVAVVWCWDNRFFPTTGSKGQWDGDEHRHHTQLWHMFPTLHEQPGINFKWHYSSLHVLWACGKKSIFMNAYEHIDLGNLSKTYTEQLKISTPTFFHKNNWVALPGLRFGRNISLKEVEVKFEHTLYVDTATLLISIT